MKYVKVDETECGVNFKLVGAETIYFCSHKDWEVKELKMKLVEAGASEKLINDLFQLGWEMGYDEGKGLYY